MFIKIAILVIFVALTIGVGLFCRKKSGTVSDFALGGRKVGPWLTAFAFGTSYFSAVIFVGYAGQFGWNFGLASTWIGLGNALIGSLLSWWILGKRTQLMTKHLHSATMPDFFEKRFKSKSLKIISSIIIFAFLIPYTASLFNGLSRLFEIAFNVDYTYCVIGMAIVTGIYVVVGGYFATAVNDFIQGIIMLFGIVVVIFAVLNTQGGLFDAVFNLSQVTTDTGEAGLFTTIFGPQPFSLVCVVLLTSLGTWGLPQMIQKFYAIKDKESVKKGTIISTIFAVIVAGGCYFLGGFGRLFVTQEFVDINGYDSIIPTMLSTLPDILIGIVIVLVLSASISTLSSLVLTSSTTITLDLVDPLTKNRLNEKNKVFLMRTFVVIFIAISSIIAIIQVNSHVTFIAQLMGISWGTIAGAFLAPYLYSLYSKKITKASVYTCFVMSIGLMMFNLLFKNLLPTFLQSPINMGVCCMLLGLIIVPIVSSFTKKIDAEHLNFVFDYKEKN